MFEELQAQQEELRSAKLTPEGRVSLEVSRAAADSIEFSIVDTGIGIAPNELELIFERRAPTRRSISEPLRRPVSQTIENLLPLGRTILVIEDDETFAQILRDLTRKQHFQALVATTAAEGFALTKEFAPSAILLDVQLPVQSGLALLEHLKRQREPLRIGRPWVFVEPDHGDAPRSGAHADRESAPAQAHAHVAPSFGEEAWSGRAKGEWLYRASKSDGLS